MVTGFHIFIHSVQMILRNRADVFRLAALPLVVALGALLALGTLGSAAKSGGMPNPGAALVFLPLLFIAGACALWFIVNWHRFILLEEYPQGWMPKFRGDRVLSYLGHSLLLVIVMLCGLVPVLIVQLVVLQSGNFEILAAVMVGTMFIISILCTRLSLILPAAAIN
ncbi:MAG: hypothetical protein MJH10_03375 [Epibacterium sp.]|nr:hypothetical protein [Epibacterium sp.]NQX72597.1 hypothetical protein [Epibacterium sp.]